VANENEIKLSVRNLVEFVLRSGDLDMRFMGSSRALEGTRIHSMLQKLNKEEKIYGSAEYKSEVALVHTFNYKDFTFLLEGRADGIIVPGNEEVNLNFLERIERVTIDEIKSTARSLEEIDENYNELHWAQGKCYAYIYADQNGIDAIDVQLTYYQIDTEQIKYFKRSFTKEELKLFIYELIEKYFVWADYTRKWNNKREKSIRNLSFPFDVYRKGQRDLAVSVYKTISEEKKIFVQAPTGIGKTISTLFPAVKAIGEGCISKIFYLTAKTITRQVAEEAITKMRQKCSDFHLKSITLTAKDKICFNKGSACNPEQCNYAKGHFNRVNDAIMEILNNENDLTREKIEKYALRHEICPFEFSLDLAVWADCVICDYNYAFDPRVYLKRFFGEGTGDFVFLVDEAHNLVDRAREMFSAELNKRRFLDLKKLMKEKQISISRALGKLNSYMLDISKECEDGKLVIKEEPKDIYPLLRKFIKESEEWLVKNEKIEGHEELLQLYFDALAFIRISELYDDRFVTYVEEKDKDYKIKLFCLDPSYLLGEAVKRGKAAVFFSATLTPINYYKEILGGGEEDYTLRLASPFDREKLCLLIGDGISTKYKNREKSYDFIVNYIKTVFDAKKGNYLIFFPSYKYMNEVYSRFSERYPDVNIMLQQSSMDEEEREKYLYNFKGDNGNPLIGFAVLGGIFSEGIDLKGNRLIGAIIVGVGLPQICLERDIIKEYFQNKNKLGYEYSYMYPGMNKVLQAAGRVIRSEEDTGIVLLLDERFSTSVYQNIFPREWFPNIKVKSTSEVNNVLNEFWNQKFYLR
jgi:DNA excision repair protein ERCC-2